MKIDLRITDCTPEEANRILAPLAMEGMAARIIKEWSHVPKPVPDPTCPEETGCADCDNAKGSDFEKCHACSPPPIKEAKTVPIEHHTAQNPEKTRAHNGPVRPGQPGKEKEAIPHKGPHGGNNGKVNKYGIPPELNGTDRKKYMRLYDRCKRLGLTYEAALALEKTPEIIVKESPQPIASSNEVKEPAAKTMDTLSPNTIATGMHVRQIKPDQGRQIFGTAVVLARVGDMIEVRNGGGKKHKIDARCLEIVPAGEASDRATGGAS